MGYQLFAKQKCYIKILTWLIETSVAIVREDQIGKILLTVFLCNLWFPEQVTLNLEVWERADKNIKKKESQG
jgi:hypothetical protein